MKKLIIKNCGQCPHFSKGGPYGKVMYRPFCSNMPDGKYLPFIELLNKGRERYRAQPTYEIPEWCLLEDY